MHHQYSMKISPRFPCFMVKPPLFNMFDYLSWLYPHVGKSGPVKSVDAFFSSVSLWADKVGALQSGSPLATCEYHPL